jgi:hypothetical protein
MSDYNFPESYDSTDAGLAARQIAAAWIEAVLRGNARDLHTTSGWTDAHRNAVKVELKNLQARLDPQAGVLNPNSFAPPEEQIVKGWSAIDT